MAAVLVLAVLLAYGGSLGAPFVYDDTLAIPENQTIRRIWALTDILWPQAEGGLTVSGRPVLNLSFAINYAVSGTNVWSYHVFNIMVHAGSALLLFGIARRTFAPKAAHVFPGAKARAAAPLAFAIAAVWSLHPLLTQAVTYTVQRAESLMGFFYLLTLYAFIRGADALTPMSAAATADRGSTPTPGKGSRMWWGLSVAACVLGMATKEVMATAPLMVLLYDRTFRAGSLQAALRERLGYHLALAATWLVLAALVASTGGNRGGTAGIGTGVPFWAYPLTQFEAVARYLALAAWPHPLIFEYGTFWAQRAADFAPYALLILPLLAATTIALLRSPALGFCGAWFFLILAPTSLTPGTIQMVVEHRMYLPLVAIVALAVSAVHRWFGRSALFIAAVAAVALGLLTYRRNQDYRSHLALWGDTVAKRPENPRAHDGLAEAFTELGRVDEALLHRREAVRLEPNESKYHYNLGMTLSAANQPDEALRHYQTSLRLAPDESRTHNNLAILLGQRGDDGAALSHYGEAVRLKPNDPLYHYNHGVAQMRVGRFAGATESFEAALRLRPTYADAQFNLGTALARQGRLDAALAHYEEALRLKPQESEYRIAFGGALLLAKNPEKALAEFQRVLADKPDSIEAMFGAANALAALRRTAEAISHYESVLRRAPTHSAAHFKLGNVLLDIDRVPAAVEHYVAAVRLTPDDAEAHHNLGVAYARLERWAEAQAEFEKALGLKPDYTDARRNLEQLKTLLGR